MQNMYRQAKITRRIETPKLQKFDYLLTTKLISLSFCNEFLNNRQLNSLHVRDRSFLIF